MDDVTFDEVRDIRTVPTGRSSRSSSRKGTGDFVSDYVLFIIVVLAIIEAILFFMHGQLPAVDPQEAAKLFPH